MLATKDIYNKVFDYIYPWGETLIYISWEMREYYYRTIQATLGQAVFFIEMVFNLTSIIYRQVITSRKQQQVDIDIVWVNARQFTHDYTVGNLVYVEMNGIYQKLDYKKQGSYRIKVVFTNFIYRLKRVKVNKFINIRRLLPHLIE